MNREQWRGEETCLEVVGGPVQGRVETGNDVGGDGRESDEEKRERREHGEGTSDERARDRPGYLTRGVSGDESVEMKGLPE